MENNFLKLKSPPRPIGMLTKFRNSTENCLAVYKRYVVHSISIQTFFVQAFKIVVDS